VNDLATAMRAKGMRWTAPRRRIVDALARLGHATPEEIVAEVTADGGSELAPSTVYRALDALQELGFVAHSHFEKRSPSYHLAGHADHVHLVCLGCGDVGELPVQALRRERGFAAEVTHLAVQGWCAGCRGAAGLGGDS
jgi:Fur family ferric uptake transcriptional regulator